MIGQLRKLGKYKFTWSDNVLEISLKSSEDPKTIGTLLKFQKSGNVITGNELYTFAGCSATHDSCGRFSLKQLANCKNQFKDYEAKFQTFEAVKQDLDELMKKDKLSDEEVRIIINYRYTFNEYVEDIDTARMQSDEKHKSIVELYLDILGFSKKDAISENPFIQIENTENDYGNWRKFLVKCLKYDDFKMLIYSFILNESEIKRDGKVIFSPKKLTLKFCSDWDNSSVSGAHRINISRQPKMLDDETDDEYDARSEISCNSVEFRSFTSVTHKRTAPNIPTFFHELLHAVHGGGRNGLDYMDFSPDAKLKIMSQGIVDSIKSRFYIPADHIYTSWEAKLIINQLYQFHVGEADIINLNSADEIFAVSGIPYKSAFGYGLSHDLFLYNLGRPLYDAHVNIYFRYNTNPVCLINDKPTLYSDLIEYNLQQTNNKFKTSNYHNEDKIKYLNQSSDKIYNTKYETLTEYYTIGMRFSLRHDDMSLTVRAFLELLGQARGGIYGVKSSFTEPELVDFLVSISSFHENFNNIVQFNKVLNNGMSWLGSDFGNNVSSLLYGSEQSTVEEELDFFLRCYCRELDELLSALDSVNQLVLFAKNNLHELNQMHRDAPGKLEKLTNKFLKPYLNLEALTSLEIPPSPEVTAKYPFDNVAEAREFVDEIYDRFAVYRKFFVSNLEKIKTGITSFCKEISNGINES